MFFDRKYLMTTIIKREIDRVVGNSQAQIWILLMMHYRLRSACKITLLVNFYFAIDI